MSGVIIRGATIPESELVWSFDPSGGPGGQHANRSSTRVTLAFDLDASDSIPTTVKERIRDHLGKRVANGVITVTVDESRSQWRNRAIARDRLRDLIDTALTPVKSRTATRPSRAARRRRLADKRKRSEAKRLRQRPDAAE